MKRSKRTGRVVPAKGHLRRDRKTRSEEAQVATRLSAESPAVAGVDLCLSVFEGPDAGSKMKVSRGRTVIGRGGADLPLADPSVAEQHCALEVSGTEVRLRDLSAGDGTRVNGEPVSETTLRHRDEIRVGSTGIVFTAVPGGGDGVPETAAASAPEPADDATPTHTALDGEAHRPKTGFVRPTTGIFLEVIDGPEAGVVFDLTDPRVYLIGRQYGAIALNDGRCSRKHAQVEILGEGEYYLCDLASTNGTFLNDVRATRRRLKHMDIVRVGRTRLRFSCVENSIPVTSD